MGSKRRREHRDAMPRLCQGQQRMWGTALEPNLWCDPGQTGSGVKCAAKTKAPLEQQQWMRRKLRDFDRTSPSKLETGRAPGEELDGFQWLLSEASVIQPSRVKQILPEMDFATFQHGQDLAARPFAHSHFHAGIALSVLVQKLRKYAFDMLRRGADFQHALVSASQQFRLLPNSSGVSQQGATFSEQLLSFAGQQKPAADAIEKLEAELVLEIADLS